MQSPDFSLQRPFISLLPYPCSNCTQRSCTLVCYETSRNLCEKLILLLSPLQAWLGRRRRRSTWAATTACGRTPGPAWASSGPRTLTSASVTSSTTASAPSSTTPLTCAAGIPGSTWDRRISATPPSETASRLEMI